MLKARYTKKAVSDLVQAYEYISGDSQQNAEMIIARIEKAVNSLCLYPDIGRKGRKDTTREFVVSGTPFILVYRHNANYLRILTVLHRARQYPADYF